LALQASVLAKYQAVFQSQYAKIRAATIARGSDHKLSNPLFDCDAIEAKGWTLAVFVM
jgi:hypothetical protein